MAYACTGGEGGSTSKRTGAYKGGGGVEKLVFLGVRTLWMLPYQSASNFASIGYNMMYFEKAQKILKLSGGQNNNGLTLSWRLWLHPILGGR